MVWRRLRIAADTSLAALHFIFQIVQGWGDDHLHQGNDSNLLIVFYVQIMPDDFVMQLHRF